MADNDGNGQGQGAGEGTDEGLSGGGGVQNQQGAGEGLSGGAGSGTPGQGGAGDGTGAGQDGKGAGKDGGQDGAGAGSSLLGVPEKGYGDFTLPEQSTVDADMMKLATDAFQGMGLSQEGGQKIVDLYVEISKYQDAKFEEIRSGQVAEYKKQWKANQEFGQAHIDQSQIWIKKAVDVLFKDDPYNTIQYLAATGEEFHPGLMLAFARAGKLLSDDTFDGGGDGTHRRTEDKRSIAERMYPNLPLNRT